MVEAGTLELNATLDTSDFERGERRVNQGLNNTQSEALSTNNTFTRLGSTIGGIASTFATMGAAGVTALTGLGLKSPIVADELAKIKVSLFNLGNAVAPSLEPVLNTFSELVDTVTGFQGTGVFGFFGSLGEAILSVPIGLLNNINDGIEKFKELTGKDTPDNVGGTTGNIAQDIPAFSELLSIGSGRVREEGLGVIPDFFKGYDTILDLSIPSSLRSNFNNLFPQAGAVGGIGELLKIFSGENNRKQTTLNTAD